MKKLVSILLVLTLMCTAFSPMTVSAKNIENNVQSDTVLIDVVDTNGNVVGQVASPRMGLASGATIFYLNVEAAFYNGVTWVLTHPEATAQTIDFLINLFEFLQNTIGQQLKEAYHNGTEYTKAVTTSGNQCFLRPNQTEWTCLYSL